MRKLRRTDKNQKAPPPRHTLYRPAYKILKMLWVFHKGDADCNPSVPHGHSVEGNYRLSLWDGTVYKKHAGKLKLAGTAKPKEMLALFTDSKFQQFVNETRNHYESNNPSCQPLRPLSPYHFAQGKYRLFRSVNVYRKSVDIATVSLTIKMKS